MVTVTIWYTLVGISKQYLPFASDFVHYLTLKIPNHWREGFFTLQREDIGERYSNSREGRSCDCHWRLSVDNIYMYVSP